jgi:hypothetical protein
MKKYLILSILFATLSSPVFTQESEDECDEDFQDCREGQIKEPSKDIYPYRPFDIEHIDARLKALTESNTYLKNVRLMESRGLNRRSTSKQPWGGSYWPLNQGMIGNTYHDKDFTTFILSPRRHLSWRKNVRDYRNRQLNVHPYIMSLSESELAKLAPSEKYDLLLGDTSFDLTNRVWDFAEKWGEEKRWGFLSHIDLPAGYRVPKSNKRMGLWEGICQGWAVAAGHSERPARTVWVTLPNGKRMPFYPNDIKALVSLMWAHSTIQDNVIVEGLRCNRKSPDRDRHGRYIDTEIDRNDTQLLPRCADVHPGIFHLALINIVGVEGRSFVVDKDAEAAINNQPVSGYELEYYNPRTGKKGPLRQSIISARDYGHRDNYRENRHPKTTHIVGVEMKLNYIKWEFPRKSESNSFKDDKIDDMNFNYDLELDANGDVIGGQWRVSRKGNKRLFKNKTGQPDFFWVVPKDWKKYFIPIDGLPQWNITSGKTVPGQYREAAFMAHNYVYEESKFFFGTSPMCQVFPIEWGAPIKVNCEFRYPRPQPLLQVVDQLLKMSR